MDDKAVKRFLIGYDGDERYRVWVPTQNKIICSRDVIFDEKISVCEKADEITSKDDMADTEGKIVVRESSSASPSIEENPAPGVLGHIPKIEKDNGMVDEETVSEPEERSLRPRVPLRAPKRFDDFIMIADE